LKYQEISGSLRLHVVDDAKFLTIDYEKILIKFHN